MYSRDSKRKVNSKQKPLGSGTTSNARKERRAAKFGNVNAQDKELQNSTWEEAAWQDPAWQEPAWQEPAWEEQAWQEPVWEKQDWQEPASSSKPSKAEVLATAPWRRGDSDDEDDPLVKGGVQAPSTPPLPQRLVAAQRDLSSSNSSDDWGWWKSNKHRRVSSDEKIEFVGGVIDPGDALPRVCPKIGLDWLGVIQVFGEIPAENIAAIQKLFDHGVEVCVLSWCVETVGQQFLAAAKELPFFDKFSTFAWTDSRTGENGKVEHWSNWGCDVIIEKGEDICKEALSQGMHVFPVQVGEQSHEWFTELGHTPSPNLTHAVDAFLQLYF